MRDLSAIAGALRITLPKGERLSGISTMSTGFSNDTYLIEGVEQILRMPPAAGAMLDGHDVLAQAKIYATLGTTPGAPPVPRIFHIEHNVDLLGAPFYVMEKVQGESVSDLEPQAWFTDVPDSVRNDMCRDWVSVFAGLAKLPPIDVLGAPISPKEDLEMWQRFAGAANCPQLVGAIDRLLNVPAPLSGEPSVVHGDTKLSNLMWHDNRISAVLDWEMSINGEPLADLGYMLYLFPSRFHGATRAPKQPGMMTRDEVIERWEEVSGRSADGVYWHEIAQIAKICAIIAEGSNMLDTGRSNDPKLTYFKQNLSHYLSVMNEMLADGGY